MKSVFIDTDILINYSKGKDKTLDLLFNLQSKQIIDLYINPIVISEFFADTNLKNTKRLEMAKEFISLFRVIDIDKKAGLLAGKMLRNKQSDFLGDALIASSCVVNKISLATGNKKHFAKIPKLEFYDNSFDIKQL